MAHYDAIFKNGTIVNQDGTHRADIGIRGGLIAALGACKPLDRFCDGREGLHPACPIVDDFPQPQP